MRKGLTILSLLTLLWPTPALAADEQVALKATGTLEPEEVVDVGAQVAGAITSFGKDKQGKPIDYGSEVEAGTILAQIDPRAYQAQLKQARAAVRRARAALGVQEARVRLAEQETRRLGKLHVKNAVAEDDLEKARLSLELEKAKLAVNHADIETAEASLEHAAANLDYCTIRSPVKGVIVDRRVNVGQTVVASLSAPSLFLIAKDLTRMQIWVSVPEAGVGKVTKRQAVRFTVDAFPAETYSGTVEQVRLNATMVKDKVSYTIVVRTDNARRKLLPYMTANVEFLERSARRR
jgi:HlyD family secretion protein